MLRYNIEIIKGIFNFWSKERELIAVGRDSCCSYCHTVSRNRLRATSEWDMSSTLFYPEIWWNLIFRFYF